MGVLVRGQSVKGVAALLASFALACSSGSGDGGTHGPTVTLDGGSADGSTGVDGSGRDVASVDGGSSSLDASTDVPGDREEVGSDACTGSIAVFGGSLAGASTIAFGATLLHGGSWSISSLPTNVTSPPAIAAFGGGFVAAFVDANGHLEFATSTWTWSSPAPVGASAARGSPSLAVLGGSLHVIYQGSDSMYYHGIYAADSGWDAANDPVGGAKHGFGPNPPVAEGETDALLIAYSGQNGSLYDEAWSPSTWAPDDEHTLAEVGQLSPAIAALHGGTSDALIVYADPSGTLYFTSRSGGAWSAPAVIDVNAFTHASPSLAALAGGGAVMTYLGTNQLAYFSVYDPKASPEWTSPAAVETGSTKLSSPPSVAPGVCGDDAIAVLAEPAGVAAVRYVGGTWTLPTTLPGTAGMTFASVATKP